MSQPQIIDLDESEYKVIEPMDLNLKTIKEGLEQLRLLS